MALTGYSIPDTVVDDDGNVRGGLTLTVTGPSAYSGTATTDAVTGLFRLGPLPVGDYTVTYGSRSAVVPVIAVGSDLEDTADTATAALALAQAAETPTGAQAKADAAEDAAVAAAATATSGTHAPLLTPPTTVTYNADGSVATQTINGVTTTYTYNVDGTVATETRGGVTRTYSYTDGNLTAVA